MVQRNSVYLHVVVRGGRWQVHMAVKRRHVQVAVKGDGEYKGYWEAETRGLCTGCWEIQTGTRYRNKR